MKLHCHFHRLRLQREVERESGLLLWSATDYILLLGRCAVGFELGSSPSDCTSRSKKDVKTC